MSTPRRLPVAGLPPAQLVAINPRGDTVYIGDGSTVTGYELVWMDGAVRARELYRHDLRAEVGHLVAARTGDAYATAVTRDGARLVRLTDAGPVPLAMIPARVTALAVTRSYLVLGLATETLRPAELLVLTTDGRTVGRLAAPGDRPRLTPGGGDTLLVARPGTGTQRLIRLDRAMEGCVPCPPRPVPPPSSVPVPASLPPGTHGFGPCHQCGGGACRCCDHKPEPPEQPPARPEPDLRCRPEVCVPGDTGDADDCVVTYVQPGGGWAVSVNVCEPDRPACRRRLDWEIGSLQRIRGALVAASAEGHRLAVLRPGTLDKQHEFRVLPGTLTRVLAAPDAQHALLLYADGSFELLDAAPAAATPAQLGANVAPRTYHGAGAAADWTPDGLQTGTRTVLVVPVLEHGQEFEGDLADYADLPELKQIRDTATAYYREATYHHGDNVGLDVRFRVFGVDTPVIYEGGPMRLPAGKTWKDYWGPEWDPGHVRLPWPLGPGGWAALTFSGVERMWLQAKPSVRSARTFVLDFPSASFRARIPDGAMPETYDSAPAGSSPQELAIGGVRADGTPFAVALTAASLAGTSLDGTVIDYTTMDQQSTRDDLAAVLQQMLVGAGLDSDLEPPQVSWHDDGDQKGLLYVSFGFKPAPPGAPQPPVIEVFDAGDTFRMLSPAPEDSIDATFQVPGDEEGVREYFIRVLAEATVRHEDFDHVRDPYFDLVTGAYAPAVTVEDGNVWVRISLSTRDGSKPGTIEFVGEAGVRGLAAGQVTSGEGVDIEYTGAGAKLDRDEDDILARDVFTAMVRAAMESPQLAALPQDLAADLVNAYFSPPDTADGGGIIHNVVVTSVHPTTTAGLGAAGEPDIQGELAGLRPVTRQVVMRVHPDEPWAEQVKPISSCRRKIFMWMRPDKATSDARVLAHELGHGLLGLIDLYRHGDHRADLQYVDENDVMGSGAPDAHFCAYHKRIKGWLPDRADLSSTLLIPRPDDSNPYSDQVVLVQLEGWDPNRTDADWSSLAQSLVGASDETPVRAAVFCALGGDLRHYDIIEVRGPGAMFSTALTPRVLITNAIDFDDDTRYGSQLDPPGEDPPGVDASVVEQYRAPVHLLDDSTLAAVNDTFDFGTDIDKLTEAGLVVKVLDWYDGTGSFPYHMVRLQIDWTRGDAVDLGFRDSTPDWNSTEIAVLPPGPGGYDPQQPDVKPPFPDQDPEAIERFRVPKDADEEPIVHKVLVRVTNFGSGHAASVQTDLEFRRPAGAGDAEDAGAKALPVIASIEAGKSEYEVFDWTVDHTWFSEDVEAHACLRARIRDWDVVPPASDDTNDTNIWAQQNVFTADAATASPPKPVEFPFRVYNDSWAPQVVTPIPRGLPPGGTVTVTPGVAVVAGKSSRIFRVRVEAAEELLKQKCGSDLSFLLEAWRRGDDTDVRWGASKYVIRPRFATKISLDGSVLPDKLTLFGAITPDVGARPVLLHIQLPGQLPIWEEIMLGPGSTYQHELAVPIPSGQDVKATARFTGDQTYAKSISPTIVRSWTQQG